MKKCWIFFLLSFTSCQEQDKYTTENIWGDLKEDSLNILRLLPTDFKYKNNIIYQYDSPKLSIYNGFPNQHYSIVDNKSVKLIYLFSDCVSSYKSGNYELIEIDEKVHQIKEVNPCDIVIRPFIDFSIKRGQKITVNGQEILLQSILYDSTLIDTVYKFRR